MDWFAMIAAAIGGYLLGSIPTGYLIGKIHRIDVRRFGSGRTGGTNVLRVLGWVPALLTAAGDLLKGIAAILVAKALSGSADVHAVAAVCAVLGHNYTFTLKFKGGAGVATMLGTLVLLSPPTVAVVFPVGLAVAVLSRYASLASLTLATLLPIGMGLGWVCGKTPSAYFVASLAISTVVVWAHRPNITRLLRGTERKVGQRLSPRERAAVTQPPDAGCH